MSSTGTTSRPSLTPTVTTDSGTTTPTTSPTSTTPTSTTPTSTTPTNTTPTNTNTTPTNTGRPPPTSDTGTPTSDTGSQQLSTVFSTTFVTTDAGGQTVTTVSMGVTSIPDPNANSNSVAVGPIVGGVLGGVGGILLLGLIAWLAFFRKKRPDKYEDGMFDPDKNIQRPGRVGGGGGPGGAFDLGADEIGAARVTPFVLGAGAGAGAGAGVGAAAAARHSQQQPYHQQQQNYPEMRSYTASDGASDYLPNPYSAPPSAYGGMAGANLRRGPTTSSNSSGGYPASVGNGQGGGTGGYHTEEAYLMSPTTTFSSPSSGQHSAALPPLPPGASGAGSSAIPGVSAARAAKEREAFSNTRHAQATASTNAAAGVNPNRFSQHGPLVLSNPSLPSPEGEVPPPGVVVHRDGGRVREPEPVADDAEIPPTYDSIPNDSR